MGAAKGGSLTERQKNLVKEYQNREEITDNQRKELNRLIAKRESKAELPAGAKTYCEEWLKSQLYDKRKDFSSSEVEKGNRVENDGIELLGKYIGNPFLFKNQEYAYNDFLTGTCDVKTLDRIYDIKCSRDAFSFPLLRADLDNGYWAQLQGYAELYNKDNLSLVYCLVNTPLDMIERSAWYKAKSKFGPDFEEDQYAKILEEEIKNNTYDDTPIKLRVKKYDFERDKEFMQAVKQRVDLCRDYICEMELYLIKAGVITD